MSRKTLKHMLFPIGNTPSDLALLLLESEEFDYTSKEQAGFILSNDFVNIEFFHNGPQSLIVEYSTQPKILLEGGIDPSDKTISGINTEVLYCLTKNRDILAQSEFKKPITLAATEGNTKLFKQLKDLEKLAKNYSEKTFIEPQAEWFTNANILVHETLTKANFYEIHKKWFKEYKIPKMNPYNKLKHRIGLPYKIK